MSIDLIKRLRLGTGTSPDHELLLEAAKAIEEYRMKYILAAEGKDRAQRRLSELEAQLEELQKQEPVAWMARSGSGTTVLPDERMNKDYYNIPLYTAPIPPVTHCKLGCTTECKAKAHGCASECPALPWQPAASLISPIPTPSQQEAIDAMLYRWWKQNRSVTLITAIFGNGCINKTMADTENFILARPDTKVSKT